MLDPDDWTATHRFEHFHNAYPGSVATIVGCGTTTYDYEKLHEVAGPIFFVNAAYVLEKYTHPQCPVHYVSWHPGDFAPYVEKACRPRTVLWGELLSPRAIYFRSEHWTQDTLPDPGSPFRRLLLDADWAVANQTIWFRDLSPTLAIHLAYLFGCRDAQFVGCHPTVEPKHDPRIDDRPFPQSASVERVGIWAQFFGFSFTELK
jgi:hypothetical protein